MNVHPRQAIILSAGLGTRLRPLTDAIPKVMIPILDKPLLEWHLEQYKKHGVKEFFVNLHYLPDIIRNYFEDGSRWGVRIYYGLEPVILGTAGGAKQFEEKLDDVFYLIYGDTFSLMDYGKMAATFAQKPQDAIGMQRIQRMENYADADVAELDDDGKFVAIHSKPHQREYPNAYRMRGAFILKKKILSYVPPNTYYEVGRDLLPEVVSKGEKFYAYECNDYSKGIDTMEKYKEVESYLRQAGYKDK